MRNCTRDEGRPFEFGNQVLISSHRKLLSSKTMVVIVAAKSGRGNGLSLGKLGVTLLSSLVRCHLHSWRSDAAPDELTLISAGARE
jgi:hypothetical protein